MPHSKRFNTINKDLAKNTLLALPEAVAMVKKNATAKFDESVELSMNLGIDPKQSDQQIRPTVVLPHGTGKSVRVAAFVDSVNETIAKEAGADIVGTEETIEKLVKSGVIEFDVAVAVPSMMAKLAKAARLLGPRGLMPNPKTDTVGPDIAKMIKEQKGGKISFKTDATSNIHTIIGKASFSEQQLLENATTIVEAIKKAKPASAKGIYIKSATMSSSMGPGVALDTTTL